MWNNNNQKGQYYNHVEMVSKLQAIMVIMLLLFFVFLIYSHMLTGVFEPTSGKAYINGRSILSQMDDIRTTMGFCPQYDILYDL